jgi:hypothetical protein
LSSPSTQQLKFFLVKQSAKSSLSIGALEPKYEASPKHFLLKTLSVPLISTKLNAENCFSLFEKITS